MYERSHNTNTDLDERLAASFLFDCKNAENGYNWRIQSGWQPQQCRVLLPVTTKCETIMTGFVSDWKHFFELRTAQSDHPQMRELAIPLRQMFIDNKYIKE